ncbi:MAG: uroporphyrinogen-III synthase [Pseudomonadota bacterium]
MPQRPEGHLRSVIVTRPEADAVRWVEDLRRHGLAAEALPLIEIAPHTDLAPARQAWLSLQEYSAVMFVSGNAVQGFFTCAPGGGPSPTVPASLRFMAPGPGTASLLRSVGVPAGQIDCPGEESSQFDSQALWQLVGKRPWQSSRVLIVRGQSGGGDGAAPGREWLARQWEAAGARVDFVTVYQRKAPRYAPAQLERMARGSKDGSVWLLSSSEALAHIPDVPGAQWSRAIAVATHPRIAAAARAAGWGVVIESRPQVADIVASIESMDP